MHVNRTGIKGMSKKHTSLSGEKAKISREAGGRFTPWGGHITGFSLVVKPERKLFKHGELPGGGQIIIPLRSSA
jgi:hypothetical protein